MKNVVYFLLLSISIEQRKVAVRSAKTETVKSVYTNNGRKANFDSSKIPCEDTDLFLQDNDDRLLAVTEMDLFTNCPSKHLWKITSSNTFKRFQNVHDFFICGSILLPENVETSQKLQSQLFNVPTIEFFEYQDCFIEDTRGKAAHWTLPPNAAKIYMSNCDLDQFDWKNLPKLKHLRIVDNEDRIKKLPKFGHAFLTQLDLRWAGKIDFSILEIAFLCEMTELLLNSDALWADHCRCELLKQWKRYLETEKITLTIHTSDVEDFMSINCHAKECPSSENSLRVARNNRVTCLSSKLHPSKDDAIVNEKFNFTNWVFWLFIIGGFLIISLIFVIFMFAAEKFTKKPESTEATSFTEEEDLVNEDSMAEQTEED